MLDTPVCQITLAAVPAAAGCARAFTTLTLRHWQHADLIDSTELVASELVTNSVKATGPAESRPPHEDLCRLPLLCLRLQLRPAALRIAVWDTSEERPCLTSSDVDAEGGRGLELVAALSRHWGSYPVARGGKVVWAELTLGPTGEAPCSPPRRLRLVGGNPDRG